ncbi:MAG: GGDEF domain-containing protein, partial [Symbiobacteriia bacterium]
MFYLLLSAITLVGLFLLLNGEWIFRIQQDRRVGALVVVALLILAETWARVRGELLPGVPDLYPLVAVMAGLFLGLGWGALAGAAVALVSAATTLTLGARPQSALELVAALLVYSLMGALTGRISDRLRSLAFTDSLTGLYNRRYFFEQLEPEVARALRYSFPLSVLIVDLDYFKFYNDRLGHVAGDIAHPRFGD